MNLNEAMGNVRTFFSWPAEVRDCCVAMHNGLPSAAHSVSKSGSTQCLAKNKGKVKRRKFTKDEEKSLETLFSAHYQERVTVRPDVDPVTMDKKVAKRIAREFRSRPETISRKYTTWYTTKGVK